MMACDVDAAMIPRLNSNSNKIVISVLTLKLSVVIGELPAV